MKIKRKILKNKKQKSVIKAQIEEYMPSGCVGCVLLFNTQCLASDDPRTCGLSLLYKKRNKCCS